MAEQLDTKSIKQSLKSLRSMIDEFAVEFSRKLDEIELGLGNEPTGDLSKRLKFLEEIHKKGGTVDKKTFKEIGEKFKYGRTGSFFKGKRASLASVVSDGEEKIALTQYGLDQLKRNSIVN